MSKKISRFSIDEWFGRVGSLEPGPGDRGYWCGRTICGPRDACLTARLRQMVGPFVLLGDPSPTDVFVLSIGESLDRSTTKIGGLPFFSQARSWPTNESGSCLPFFAQFNFAYSRDIVGEVPGDILLIFGAPDLSSGLSFEWESLSNSSRLVAEEDIPSERLISPFFGTRWRTVNYPDWSPRDNDSWEDMDLSDGSTVLDVWFVFELLGLQIGTHPFLIPVIHLDRHERVLCSLCGIAPATNTPYPFLNHPEPLTNADGVFCDIARACEMMSGIGALYVTITDSGQLNWISRRIG